MQIERFTDQYAEAGGLYGVSAQDLRRRDESLAGPPLRWLAFRDETLVGAATAVLRPDDRMFIDFSCRELSAHGPLSEAAAGDLDRPLYTTVRADDRASLVVLRAAGFGEDFVGERFRIRFDEVIPPLDRTRLPTGFSIEQADTVDEGRLFTLDNTLRHDVPGIDGWRGDRHWFHRELNTSPPFDPRGYLVARDDRNGEHIGLARIWRNPDGPHFGLIGVLRQYRRTAIAAALLKQSLIEAAGWGFEAFTVDTSKANTSIYRSIERLGAESLGQTLRLIRI